mmetsp:Transcript_17095/g.29565  ORF Transcript_17095/g.29565 Transcript_17095/m.29565 type:complete len:349 (+) Transcript_17095:201-1247(+)
MLPMHHAQQHPSLRQPSRAPCHSGADTWRQVGHQCGTCRASAAGISCGHQCVCLAPRHGNAAAPCGLCFQVPYGGGAGGGMHSRGRSGRTQCENMWTERAGSGWHGAPHQSRLLVPCATGAVSKSRPADALCGHTNMCAGAVGRREGVGGLYDALELLCICEGLGDQLHRRHLRGLLLLGEADVRPFDRPVVGVGVLNESGVGVEHEDGLGVRQRQGVVRPLAAVRNLVPDRVEEDVDEVRVRVVRDVVARREDLVVAALHQVLLQHHRVPHVHRRGHLWGNEFEFGVELSDAVLREKAEEVEAQQRRLALTPREHRREVVIVRLQLRNMAFERRYVFHLYTEESGQF